MPQPSGTQHTCPTGFELVAQSIDPSTPPQLEPFQVLLIKAGPDHYIGTNGSVGGDGQPRDISHYDVCAPTTPPTTTEPPPTATTAPPSTVTTPTTLVVSETTTAPAPTTTEIVLDNPPDTSHTPNMTTTTTTTTIFSCEGVTAEGHPWTYHGSDEAVCDTTSPPPVVFSCERVTADGHAWTYHGSDEAVCATTQPETTTELAYTGIDGTLIAAGGALIICGALLTALARKLRKNGEK